MKRIDGFLLKITVSLGFIFIVGYCSYPVIVRHFVSVEQANKSNIKKFETNRCFFQEVVNICNQIYLEQSKTYITIDDIPKKIEKKLKRKGISSFEAKIENTDGKINIVADFHTDRFWHNYVLNNVTIIYSSYRKFDKCCDNELNALMTSICLGHGWFFDVDTDWL